MPDVQVPCKAVWNRLRYEKNIKLNFSMESRTINTVLKRYYRSQTVKFFFTELRKGYQTFLLVLSMLRYGFIVYYRKDSQL